MLNVPHAVVIGVEALREHWRPRAHVHRPSLLDRASHVSIRFPAELELL